MVLKNGEKSENGENTETRNSKGSNPKEPSEGKGKKEIIIEPMRSDKIYSQQGSIKLG